MAPAPIRIAAIAMELPHSREKNGLVGHPFFGMNEGQTLFRWSFWPPLRL
ncbi:hypothetical protein HGP13_33590 [Mesorhizobium sp. NZP2077]|nr:hypothetical protein [Mesorhizobium sp. NZP2077]QKD19508.1 hypothetical protein HGP13_33590 [Mesorhizobium sp. NZP2077]